MDQIEWTKRYQTNVQELDDQHKRMAELVTGVTDAVLRHEDREEILAALSGLMDYTRTHFAGEEELMDQHG